MSSSHSTESLSEPKSREVGYGFRPAGVSTETRVVKPGGRGNDFRGGSEEDFGFEGELKMGVLGGIESESFAFPLPFAIRDWERGVTIESSTGVFGV